MHYSDLCMSLTQLGTLFHQDVRQQEGVYLVYCGSTDL
jgi:hypothetical protein